MAGLLNRATANGSERLKKEKKANRNMYGVAGQSRQRSSIELRE